LYFLKSITLWHGTNEKQNARGVNKEKEQTYADSA
jgi:hypothetical protein